MVDVLRCEGRQDYLLTSTPVSAFLDYGSTDSTVTLIRDYELTDDLICWDIGTESTIHKIEASDLDFETVLKNLKMNFNDNIVHITTTPRTGRINPNAPFSFDRIIVVMKC